MAQTEWIRKYLVDRGYADKDIGYDNANKQVTLQGKNFYGATPDASGHTNAATSDLEKALSSFSNNQNQARLKTLSDSMVEKAQSDPVKFTSAPALAAPPPVQAYVAPAAYSGFDAENNAAYQAALRRASANAKTASANSNADMNKRGLLNSTITNDRNAQIQQGEYGRVSDTILPQLMQQDYGQYRDGVNDARYADTTNYNRGQDFYRNSNDVLQGNFNNLNNVEKANYGLSQDQISNLNAVASFLSGQGQQNFNNERALTQENLQNKQANLSAAANVGQELGRVLQPKDNWSNLYNQTDAPLNAQEQQRSFENEQNRQQQAASIANMTSDNARAIAAEARSAGNQALANLFDIWDRTGEAPPGLEGLGIDSGTKLAMKTPTSTTANFNLDDFKGYINQNFFSDQLIDPNNSSSGKQRVFDSANARKYIIGLNLPDDQTDQLLKIYQLPTN